MSTEIECEYSDPNALTRSVVVRFTDDLYDRAVRVSQDEERSLSQTIRHALKLYLASPRL